MKYNIEDISYQHNENTLYKIHLVSKTFLDLLSLGTLKKCI